MIIKRIRQSASRKRRSLQQVHAVITALTTYSVDADPELIEALARENRAANYVLDAEATIELGIEPGEKVHSHGTRNLVGNDLVGHQQQMLAACLLAPDAKDPIEHYVISWGATETPTDEQIEEVVDIFAEEMGYRGCQILWATHFNTANFHLHLVANRVDAGRRAVISPGDGWEIERLHQVIALVEARQGWASEPNALYFAQDEVVYDRATKQVVRRSDGSRNGCYKRRTTPPEKGGAPEHAAILKALRGATGWRDLHHRLGLENAAYRPKGSGAEIRVGAQRMSASDFGREFAFKKMTAKLGAYEPDITKEQDPHELYQAALREERARVREALNAALAHLRRKRHLALKDARRREHNQFLQAIIDERIQLAFDQVEARVEHEFDLVRRTIAASYLKRDRWHVAGQPPALRVDLPEIIYAGDDPADRGVAKALGFGARPFEAGAEYLDQAGGRAVSDYGVILFVHQIDAAAVELALTLANKRTEPIMVFGSPSFIEACMQIADARGFRLVREDGSPINVGFAHEAARGDMQAQSTPSGRALKHDGRAPPPAQAPATHHSPLGPGDPRPQSPKATASQATSAPSIQRRTEELPLDVGAEYLDRLKRQNGK